MDGPAFRPTVTPACARPTEPPAKAGGPAPAADDPDVLTVYEAEDGGKYRSIGAVLAAAGPGRPSASSITAFIASADSNRPETQRNLTVEATNGAVIEVGHPR